ncbi:protein GLUTAMINE DUMPER 2 [Amborella trichopoda]|uniref:Protein GLUTAMINE DUMPER 3 n=1 Tax=Amborella trichopoda TaxID=13333 RepID=W1PH10_AMBTC|nr:protein GLUTAMINE DUMPER 2 [Amborella trichopoda]ERN07243.1 hypothetical protein AMTR_s00019p00190490 [Amborella trichopoda]|eukprot:XP_006845568.1 protein GLUTAMINE DUMPER 2 [Amborella trichopoda]
MRPDSSFNSTASSAVHSPWHSPVPYLFGGLAAMLGLIAFALLILACSYWKLSGYFESGESDLAENNGEKQGEPIKGLPDLEDKIVVIMAGDQKPTFLAKPIYSKASSFTAEKPKQEEQKTSDQNKDPDQNQSQNEQQNQSQ